MEEIPAGTGVISSGFNGAARGKQGLLFVVRQDGDFATSRLRSRLVKELGQSREGEISKVVVGAYDVWTGEVLDTMQKYTDYSKYEALSDGHKNAGSAEIELQDAGKLKRQLLAKAKAEVESPFFYIL